MLKCSNQVLRVKSNHWVIEYSSCKVKITCWNAVTKSSFILCENEWLAFHTLSTLYATSELLCWSTPTVLVTYLFGGWLLGILATCWCISGTDVPGQLNVCFCCRHSPVLDMNVRIFWVHACVHRLDLGLYSHLKKLQGMESETMLTPRKKCLVPEQDRTCDAASRSIVIPTHYQLSYSAPETSSRSISASYSLLTRVNQRQHRPCKGRSLAVMVPRTNNQAGITSSSAVLRQMPYL